MGYIMGKCNQCKLWIEDKTIICPLCNNVLELNKGEEKKQGMYPDVRLRTKLFQMIERIYLIIAILLESILIMINSLTFSGVWWSVICGGVFVYLFIVLSFFVDNSNYGHVLKIAVQAICVVFITILIDFVIGYSGWSVDYVMPSVIILVNVAIIILMIVNNENWQSYISLQITMMLFGLIGIVLYQFNLIQKPILTFIAFLSSVIIFLGTILIGDKKAWNELKRKFHI